MRLKPAIWKRWTHCSGTRSPAIRWETRLNKKIGPVWLLGILPNWTCLCASRSRACKTYKSQFYNWAHRTKSTRWKPGVFSENGNGIQLGHVPKSTWAWVVTCLKLMEWRCSQDVRPARTPLPGSQPGQPCNVCCNVCFTANHWANLGISSSLWIFIPFHTYPHHYNT